MTGSIYIIHLKERRAMYEAKQGTLCIIQEFYDFKIKISVCSYEFYCFMHWIYNSK